MRKSKTKKNTKVLNKIKKTKKKLLNPFSLQPLTDAYQNFKKKQKKEIANKIKREKIEQKKQLLEDKQQKIREENQLIKDEEKRLKDLEVKRENEENQLINPLARMMWFQYHSDKHKVIQHYDNTLAGSTNKKSFTSLLYMHDTWEDTWGGELTFLNDKKPILPKPNRLMIYSRDEEHWVNEITHGIEDYKRMFLFTAWVTE